MFNPFLDFSLQRECKTGSTGHTIHFIVSSRFLLVALVCPLRFLLAHLKRFGLIIDGAIYGL